MRKFSDFKKTCLLKNGTTVTKRELVDNMSKILRLATSKDSSRILPRLVEHAFYDTAINLDAKSMKKYGLIEPGKKISDVLLNVLRSSIELDNEFVDLSIIRSPRAGKYLACPLVLHDMEYDDSSYLAVHRNFLENRLYITILNPHYLIPIQIERILKRDDEKEIDGTIYTYYGFWKQFGFNTYDEYLDDRFSNEIFEEEWVELHNPFTSFKK